MSTQSAHERNPAFTIGDRLRKAREKTGLDQGPFGLEIGVSRGTVSSYEHAETTTDLKRPFLMAWAMRSDVELEWLLTGKETATDPHPEGSSGSRPPATDAPEDAADGRVSMDTRWYPYPRAA